MHRPYWSRLAVIALLAHSLGFDPPIVYKTFVHAHSAYCRKLLRFQVFCVRESMPRIAVGRPHDALDVRSFYHIVHR